MLLEKLEHIGGQRQIAAQRLQLPLRGTCTKSLNYTVARADGGVFVRRDLPAALDSSSGGCTPVRQLKKRAAQRRKGLIPVFTLSATDRPDTSWVSLKEKEKLG